MDESKYKKGHNDIKVESEVSKYYCNRFQTFTKDYQLKTSHEVINEHDIVSKYYYKDGYDLFSSTESGIYTLDGKRVYDLYPKIVESKDLTKGRNNIKQNTLYKVNSDPSFDITISDAIKQGEKKELETYITLNGVRVEAKPIGNGRYEVTLPDGSIKYISHDGYNLKPEYVRTHQ